MVEGKGQNIPPPPPPAGARRGGPRGARGNATTTATQGRGARAGARTGARGAAGARGNGARRGNPLPTTPEGPFDPRSPGDDSNGYMDGGIGWYRKTFSLPESAKSKRVFVEFEGVYMNSEVWLNGKSLGKRPYGYSSFEYELTSGLKYGSE